MLEIIFDWIIERFMDPVGVRKRRYRKATEKWLADLAAHREECDRHLMEIANNPDACAADYKRHDMMIAAQPKPPIF